MEVGYIILIAFIILVIGLIIYGKIMQDKIRREGLEAEGIVTVEENIITDSDGAMSVDYHYFVDYKTYDGQEIKRATIGNAKSSLKNGDRIKLMYLENKPKYVVFIEKL